MPHTLLKASTHAALFLMVFAGQAMADEQNIEYTVVKGDTIWTFSQVYLNGDNAWKEVVQLNAVKEPRHLQPGARLSIPTRLLKQERGHATVVSSTGPVTVTPFGQQAHGAKTGGTVAYKDRIKTGVQGFASLQLPDGSIVSLPSNTEVQVNALAKSAFRNRLESDLSVQQGKVDALVAKQKPEDRFILRTPQAIAGVRGTEFRFGLGTENNTVLEVLDGAVAVGAAQSDQQVVRTGQLASVDAGGQISTASLPKAPQWNLDSSIQVSEQVAVVLSDKPMAQPTVHVTVANNTAFDNSRFETQSANPVINIPDLPRGVWFAKAAYILPNGVEGESQTLMLDRLLGKGDKTPSAIQTNPNGRPVQFNWRAVGNANHFRLQVAPQNQPVLFDKTVESNSSTVCCLKPGTYVWKVSAYNSANALVHESGANTLLIGPKVSLPSAAKAQ